jgi:WhiB family redox-sensing transcriptional regulator
MSEEWRDRAACRGMGDLFFYRGQGGDEPHHHVAAAKKVCNKCPVKAECLEAGLGEKYGVWGGTTDHERRAIRRERRYRAAS